MSKKQNTKSKQTTKTQDANTPADGEAALSKPLFTMGGVFLIISIGASLILVMKHLQFVEAPGCGAGGGCDQAANSPWGKVPLIDWPVSFIGLAYFVALAIMWINATMNGGVTSMARTIVRLGAAMSVLFIIVMIAGGYLCWYCLATHLGNFAFLATIELAPKRTVGVGRNLAFAGGAFAVVTALQVGALTMVDKELERQQQESVRQIVGADPSERTPFTGRYRLGPEDAPIRIVVFGDYQCKLCRSTEPELQRILAQRDDVSLSVKHFPFSRDCNRFATSRMQHGNACWAARTAETAGILRGNDGFWEMHHWLFNRRGNFTAPELRAGLAELGYDAQQFEQIMMGAEALALVQADIEEGRGIFVTSTPAIFINGVQLRGVDRVGVVTRAVQQVAASRPPSGSAINDEPAPSLTQIVDYWRALPTRAIPEKPETWMTGASSEAGLIDVVLWGDYQEPFTKAADGVLRGIMDARGDVRYAFRHYVFNVDCNPFITTTKHPLACRAAAAAEAAGALGGNDGYWRMHDWLLANQATFGDAALRAAAPSLGFDADALLAEMNNTEHTEAISADATAGRSIGVNSVPTIFINGKRLASWRYDDQPVLATIIHEAASGQ